MQISITQRHLYYISSRASVMLLSARFCVELSVVRHALIYISLSLSSCATEGVPPFNGPTNHSIILPLKHLELYAQRLQEETSTYTLVYTCVLW